jgi:hypothetical protein
MKQSSGRGMVTLMTLALVVGDGSVGAGRGLVAAEFHVSASGSPRGNGDRSHPWDLQSALNQPRSVKPGDIIWVHGGTYKGTYLAKLKGTTSKPIVVRTWKGEKATIDGGNSNGMPIFVIGASDTWFWGLEVMSSATGKISAQGTSWPTDITYGEGVMIEQDGNGGTGCKFINMIVHDTRQGFSSWKEAVDSEVYGCIVYDNGWLGSDRLHGHNFYIQNVNGTKLFSDNIILRAYSHNIQAYGSSAAYVNNLHFIGNVGVNAEERGFMLGSGNPAIRPVWKDNVMYRDNPNSGATIFYMSYPLGFANGGSQNAVVTGNYFIGGNLSFTNNTNMTFSGNWLYKTTANGDVPGMNGNTLVTTAPGTANVVVRQNKYEPKRANITVLNWKGLDTMDVDVSTILQKGNAYEVRDAQNYFGSAVLSGTYAGGSLRLPMIGGTLPARVGNDPRNINHTLKGFGVFVLMPR